MTAQEGLYNEVYKLIKKSRNIALIAHKKPDADTLGACLAIKSFLDFSGKNSVIFCKDVAADVFSFLPGIDLIVNEIDFSLFDLVICLDVAASYMIGLSDIEFCDFYTLPVVNIDHHASNDNFGILNLVFPQEASATMIVYDFFKYLNFNFDENVSTCLLAGIYSDTGSFKHSNTSVDALKVAAELLEKGGENALFIKSLFKSKSFSSLRLLGRVFENARIDDDGVIVSVLKDEDFKTLGIGRVHLSDAVEYLNMVPNTIYALLLAEQKGRVKGSLRTRNKNLDLSTIAEKFGGGGHPGAAGFVLEGSVKESFTYKIDNRDLSKKLLKI